MSVVLAVTWNPRGEMPRFERLLPQLQQVYAGLAISFPPHADPGLTRAFTSGQYTGKDGLLAFVNNDWSAGRYMALQTAVQLQADYIHYADMDRLLRWVETRPQEWRHAVEAIQWTDCLVMGRSVAAYRTHPNSLILTESISNRVVSHFLGREMDVSAGSKGFSRGAAEYLAENTHPGRALGTDAEWPILLQRAGFRVDYLVVDGLDWESADRYQEQAADPGDQRMAAEQVDADPASWEWRVRVAEEIVEVALEAAGREIIVGTPSRCPWNREE
jgi:hypothetical protein